LLDLQVVPGLNQVAEKTGSARTMREVPRFGSAADDLRRLFATWRGALREFGWTRDRLAGGAQKESERGRKSSRHLARLWANDEVVRLMEQRRQDDAVRTATEYQLVTPVTGAVVLETKQQFADAGLQAVASDTVPTVPEPGTIALLLVGGLLVGLARAWRRARRSVRPAPIAED
jgi:hypothetical protein